MSDEKTMYLAQWRDQEKFPDFEPILIEILEKLEKQKQELQNTGGQLEKSVVRLAELEEVSNTILRGLDKGISTVSNSFPHKDLISYFRRYSKPVKEHFKDRQDE